MNNVTPLITQVKLPYFTVDCGMSYVIRLSDGRFVIIDGGYGEYDETDHLYAVLEKQNALKKITIAAWFITHPHCDHFGTCTLFLNKYYGDVTLENLFFTFPREGKLNGASDMTEFLKMLPTLSETKISSPVRGDILTFSDASFEVLFSAKDLDDKEVPNINNTSLVMMMTLGNFKTLWLGDAQDQSSEFLCENHSAEKLKCDILQVGHHGYWGGSQALHEKADPTALLWPCPDFWYHPARNWAYNRFFNESKNIKAIYRGGIGEYTIDMTLPIEDQLPELFENGDIRFDFSKKSITDLGWSCVTGGQTGFAPLKASFEDDYSVTLAAGEKYSLCQTVFKDKTALTEGFTFTVKGRPETDGELFGFIFEEPTPTALNKERIRPLPISKDKDFEFTLKLDKKAESASVFDGGQCILTVPVTDTPCDIIIVMKNITVKITDVVYTDRSDA